jgi:tripartite-type tricarboxylate transporter receptor subunit TctC
MLRRSFIALASAALAAACAVPAAAADKYPERPVRIVVAYPPGGSTDIAARLLAERLGQRMGGSFVVENRPGGGGVIGANFVAQSKPDGYTLLFAASPELSIARITTKNLPYEPDKDFTPISMVGIVPFVLVANNDFPPNDIKQMIAYLKAHPGQVNFSSFGNGTSNHLTGELFNQQAGVKMVHIPYRGSSPSLTDLMGGQVQVTFDTITAVLPLIRAHKVKAIAVATPERSALVPDIPTISESGLPNFFGGTWFGLLAPKGTPTPIVDALSKNVAEILNSPDIKEQFGSRGIEPKATTPAGFRSFLQGEIDKWTKAAAKIGLEPQ